MKAERRYVNLDSIGSSMVTSPRRALMMLIVKRRANPRAIHLPLLVESRRYTPDNHAQDRLPEVSAPEPVTYLLTQRFRQRRSTVS